MPKKRPDTRHRPDARLQQVLGIGDTVHARRSPLYCWMRKNVAALQAEFAANGPLWHARTSALADAGLTDRTGKPANVRAVQQTWYRVIRDLAKAATPPRTSPAPLPAPMIPSPSTTALARPPLRPDPAADEADDRPRVRFAPSRPKNWTTQGQTHDDDAESGKPVPRPPA